MREQNTLLMVFFLAVFEDSEIFQWINFIVKQDDNFD